MFAVDGRAAVYPTAERMSVEGHFSGEGDRVGALTSNEQPASPRGSPVWRRTSRPVRRVLCARRSGPAAIHLGLPLPAGSSGLPAGIGRAVLERLRRHAPRGERALLALLRVGFTEP